MTQIVCIAIKVFLYYKVQIDLYTRLANNFRKGGPKENFNLKYSVEDWSRNIIYYFYS